MTEAIAILWIVSGVAGYGMTVEHFQGKWPELAYKERITDRVFAGFVALFGPISILALLLMRAVVGNNPPLGWRL